MSPLTTIHIRPWRIAPYSATLQAMREFTAQRTEQTADELWVVEHPPVFTQGLAGKPEHVLAAGPIPIVATERGGQVTYHGPGQVVVYLLINLARRKLGARAFVCLIEDAVIELLDRYKVAAVRKPGAPGVYVKSGNSQAGAKIAALGIKVSRGCSYHGVALNVAMDLAPWARINPCGYVGLAVTDLEHELKTLMPATPDSAEAGVEPSTLIANVARELPEIMSRLLNERGSP
jgi:lipoyl(octanoyl) transferase